MALDLLAGGETEELICPLQISRWPEHNTRCGTRHHVVGRRGLVVGLAVGPKRCPTVFFEVQFVTEYDLARGERR